MIIVSVAALTLAACGPEPSIHMGNETALSGTGRVSVTRIGIFSDELAYGDRRGVYVIVDHKSGKEYIGISGVGISETGSHNVGKSNVSDER